MRHKRKLLIALLGTTILLLTSVPVAAQGGPPEGLIAANKRKHIARDPLVDGTGEHDGGVTLRATPALIWVGVNATAPSRGWIRSKVMASRVTRSLAANRMALAGGG